MEYPESECIICKTKKWKLYLSFNQYSIWKCGQCSLGILYPQPSAEALASLYNKDYFDRIENQMPKREEDIQRELETRKYFVNWLQSTLGISAGSLLDVGSSTGFLLKVFQSYGWRVSGIEISESAAKYARDRFSLDIRIGPVSAETLGTDQFDIILMLHTFEHLPNPIGVLKLLYLHLKDNGKVIIRVPNISSLPARWHRKNWEGWRIPYHLFHFSSKSLTRIVQASGFKVHLIEYSLPKFEINLFSRYQTGQPYTMINLSKIIPFSKWLTEMRKIIAHWNKSIPLGRDITLIAKK